MGRRREPLGASEEAALVRAARAGDEPALAALIDGHRGFLVQRARRAAAGQGEVDDLIQEGVCGLLEALKRYDPERASGARLLTYARRDIDKAMRRASLRGGLRYGGARVSEVTHRTAWRLAAIEEALRAELGRTPRLAEVARAAAIPAAEVGFLREVRRRRGEELAVLDRGLAGSSAPAAHDPLEQVLWRDLGAQARRALATLPAVHRRLLARVFGLDGERAEPLRSAAGRAALAEALAALRRRIEARPPRAVGGRHRSVTGGGHHSQRDSRPVHPR